MKAKGTTKGAMAGTGWLGSSQKGGLNRAGGRGGRGGGRLLFGGVGGQARKQDFQGRWGDQSTNAENVQRPPSISC